LIYLRVRLLLTLLLLVVVVVLLMITMVDAVRLFCGLDRHRTTHVWLR
jgi:hypothetical protein